jgi:hypothetical protein
MLVKLGDGRVVECASGIRRLPPGPMPTTLAAEAVWPMRADVELGAATLGRRGNREQDPEQGASVPAMIRAGRFPGEAA